MKEIKFKLFIKAGSKSEGTTMENLSSANNKRENIAVD